MSARDRLHRLVHDLPEAEIPAAERFLEFLCRRQKPDDAQESTPPAREDSAARESLEEIELGEYLTMEEYERKRGL